MNFTITSNNSNNTSFTAGYKPPKPDDLRAIKKFANCAMSNLEKGLLNHVRSTAPKVVDSVEGIEYIAPASLLDKVVSGAKSFVGMITLDPIDALGKKFPKLGINDWSVLKRYRDYVRLENEKNTLRGIYKNGAEFVKDAMKNKPFYPPEGCGDYCHSICDPIAKNFNKLLNNSMKYDVANYDTKKERFVARMVSGGTAAVYMGKDYYNKAIKAGKSPEEAKKTETKKQFQEVGENIVEGVAQFGINSCFSEQINLLPWVSAPIGLGVSIASRIISRKISGMPLTRVKVPENRFKSFMPSIKEYEESAKENQTKELFDKKHDDEIQYIKDSKKKPFLTKEKIIGACLASIGIGFAMKGFKNYTSIGQEIADIFERNKNKFNLNNIEEINADVANVDKLTDALMAAGESSLSMFVDDLSANAVKNNQSSIFLGTRYKTSRMFKINGMEVESKELKNIWKAPFGLVKELVSYPYKLADKFTSAIKGSIEKNKCISAALDPEKLKGSAVIQDIYSRLSEIQRKYPNDKAKVAEEFTGIVKGIIDSSSEINVSKKELYKRFAKLQKKFPNDESKLFDEFTKMLKKTISNKKGTVASFKLSIIDDPTQLQDAFRRIQELKNKYPNPSDEQKLINEFSQTVKDLIQTSADKGMLKSNNVIQNKLLSLLELQGQFPNEQKFADEFFGSMMELVDNSYKKSLLKDPHDIKNIYLRFCEFQKKYPNDEAKLFEEFGKYVGKMRLASNNNMTASKGDNSKIAVIAQLINTLAGMGFNMNDEFNSSVKNGATKKEAEKDARKRGINKFFRMSVQLIISGTLNRLLVKQYNASMLGAAGVVALSTILTDKASRIMSGMPTKKVTKEEYAAYEKKHEEGFSKKYYKAIDKLAS